MFPLDQLIAALIEFLIGPSGLLLLLAAWVLGGG